MRASIFTLPTLVPTKVITSHMVTLIGFEPCFWSVSSWGTSWTLLCYRSQIASPSADFFSVWRTYLALFCLYLCHMDILVEKLNFYIADLINRWLAVDKLAEERYKSPWATNGNYTVVITSSQRSSRYHRSIECVKQEWRSRGILALHIIGYSSLSSTLARRTTSIPLLTSLAATAVIRKSLVILWNHT